MAKLLVKDYWNKTFSSKQRLWEEIEAVLPGVAAELRAGLQQGATVPKYKGTMTAAAANWIAEAKAGQAGTVLWEESAAAAAVVAEAQSRSADALEVLCRAVPVIEKQ